MRPRILIAAILAISFLAAFSMGEPANVNAQSLADFVVNTTDFNTFNDCTSSGPCSLSEAISLAHGSSTPLNDPTEVAAIKRVFGDYAYRVAMSGTKGYYGHALGASGAIEAAICALATARGWLPPTVNLVTPDPACDLDIVAQSGRDVAPLITLSNSFGFGGINAALIFRHPDT